MYDFIIGLVASVLGLNAPDTSLTLSATPYYDLHYSQCKYNPEKPIPPASERPTFTIATSGLDKAEQAALDFTSQHFSELSGRSYGKSESLKNADFVIYFADSTIKLFKEDPDGIFLAAFDTMADKKRREARHTEEQMMIYRRDKTNAEEDFKGFAIINKNVSNKYKQYNLYYVFMKNSGFKDNSKSDIPSLLSNTGNFGFTLGDVFALTFYRQGGVVCSPADS